MNKWYYLISEGGSGTNGIRNNYNVCGIGINEAAAIAYRTEQLLNSSANYTMARTMSIQAAQHDFGIGSLEEIAVTRAWYAVGVGADYVGSIPAIPITGPNAICSQSIFSISQNNVGNNANIVWSVSDPTLATITPNAGGFSATVTALVNNAWGFNVIATVTNGCSGAQQVGQKFVAIGSPAIIGAFTNAFDGSSNPLGIYPYVTNNACTGYYITTNMNVPVGTSVSWSKVSSSNVVLWNQNGNDINFYLSTPNQNVVFQCTETNSCGSTSSEFKWQSANCGTGPGGCLLYSVSPNPTNGKINVSVPSVTTNKPAPCMYAKVGATTDITNLNIAAINVYNQNGILIKQVKTGFVKQSSLDLSNLINGTYYIEIISPNDYREKQLIVLQK